MVVGGAGALVADPPAGPVSARAVAARGAPWLLGGRGRGTVGAGHGRLLHAAVKAPTLPERDRSYQALSDF